MTPLHRARRRREQFADLVRAHGAALVTVARRLAGPAEAEDVVQAALTAAWRHFASPDAIRNSRAWLTRFVVHECGNVVGRRSRQPSVVDLDHAQSQSDAEDIVSILQQELANPSTADPRLLLEYVDDGLSRALLTLNPVERTTLVLRSVAELSYKEIADAMAVPIGTVMSRLCRAREKVRLELGRQRPGSSHADAPARASEGAPGACAFDGELP